MNVDEDHLRKSIAGVLLGTAVGDALGLPMENFSSERIKRRWPGPLRMRFFFGRGMISDDTEHTLMVAQALLSHPADSATFQRALAWKLRWWFLGLPAGVGLATARACLKLWLGFSPERAGVKSGGAGPAMRSAILGACFADDPTKRREFVSACSRLTHQSWQAETAALAVAEAVALTVSSAGNPEIEKVLSMLRSLSPEAEWQARISDLQSSLAAKDSVRDFASKLGLQRGVTGYSLHVVPVALYAWLRHPDDFRAALTGAIECGGDNDTVGAICGALSGVANGINSMPEEWTNRLWDWPRSRVLIERVGNRLVEQRNSAVPLGPVRYFWPAIIPRNLFFLAIVLAHGFRR